MTDKVIKKWKQKIRSMKKEDYIVLLLMGVLLLIISLPTEKEKAKKDSNLVLEKGSEQENGGKGETVTELLGGAKENTQEINGKMDSLYNNNSYDLGGYVENLERRVEEMLSGMEGAGKVQVMITLSDMGTEVLEKDTEVNASDLEETDDTGGRRKNIENRQKEDVVYSRDAEGNEVPYVVKRKLPEISGVVVMAEGAGNAKVKENIIGAVGVLFNLNEHRIKVIRMKS